MNHREELIELDKPDFGTTMAGIAALVLLFVFGGFWLNTTELSGAIIVNGKVDIMGEAKIVQHRDGGVISSILVEPGQAVKKGQLLIELDVAEHKIRANANMEKLKHLTARLYRLQAEHKNKDLPLLPGSAAKKVSFTPKNDDLSREHELMRMRKQNLAAKKLQGDYKIDQLQNQSVGLQLQINFKKKELGLLRQEYDARQKLYKRGYSSMAALRQSQIGMSLLEGEISKLTAEQTSVLHSIEETKIALRNEIAAFHQSVLSEIIEIEAKARDIKQNLMTDQTIITRAAIRAPTSGTVHKMEVFTEGGVISPSQELLHIVPQESALEIGASLETRYVDDVAKGQKATVRLSGFDARSTPELIANVRWISPDVVPDPKTGVPFYKIKVTVPPEEIQKLSVGKLVPGMPAEIFINTGERTAYQYLTDPLFDQLRKAFKE